MYKAKILGLVTLFLLLPGNSEGQDHNRQFIDVSGDITGLTARVVEVETRMDDLQDKITREIEEMVGRIEKLEAKPVPTPVAEVSKGNFPAPANQTVKSGGSSGGSSGSFQKIPQSSALGPYANFPATYGPHWTHPGTIESHLQSTHGINTSGMSKEQMLSLHDSLHEGRVSNTQPTPVQQTTYSTKSYSTSSYRTCPPGGCPSERRGIFGRRKG